MIVFLLLIIIAILLFGSSAVLGVIGAALGFIVSIMAIFAGFAILAAMLHLTIEQIFLPAIGTICGLALLMLVVLKIIVDRQAARIAERNELPTRQTEAPVPKLIKLSTDTDTLAPVDRVWAWFAQDIQGFPPEDRDRASDLRAAGNAMGLDKLCRDLLNKRVQL